MSQRIWTREEEIIVFNLYCKIPFNKSSKSHPDVIEIAKLINRSPSAVNMKIGNFGSFDENLKKQGISGLTNTSKLDKMIWEEFTGNWDKLAYESELLLTKFKKEMIHKNEVFPLDINPEGYDKISIIKSRVNQNFFRQSVLASYASTCCITGLCTPQLLIASHIKPWRDCTPQEKTDPRNGVCLNALHDKAFDQGFITILPNYKIKISKRLKDVFNGEVINKYFVSYNGQEIMFPEKFLPNKEYLEYHNSVIFKE